MTVTIESLAETIKEILNQGPADQNADALCAAVTKALTDKEFIATHLPERGDGGKPREVLYEDPDLGFCICGHVYGDNANSKPHDHGRGWALYGQALGTTEMTDWEIVEAGDGEKPAYVKPSKIYKMSPGDARFYAIGDVHSPRRAEPTRLIRIESENMDHVTRSNIAAVQED